jgi:hypothetical protein
VTKDLLCLANRGMHRMYMVRPRAVLNAFERNMPVAEVRYETVLRASLWGVHTLRGADEHALGFVGGLNARARYRSTVFSRMFTRIAKDLLSRGGTWPWASRMCDRVCVAVLQAMLDVPPDHLALSVLVGMLRVMGVYTGAAGPVGALCARVLFAALVRVHDTSKNGVWDTASRNALLVPDFIRFALCDAKRLRGFATHVPGFLLQPLNGRLVGGHLVVRCAEELAGITADVTRAIKMLDVFFALPDSDTLAFVDAIDAECVRRLSYWLEWPRSLRCAWLMACVRDSQGVRV